MTDPKPPILFGVDPDEVWKFVPALARAAGLSRPRFHLKAPSLAATVKLESAQSEIARLAKANDPSVIEEIAALVGRGKWDLPKPSDDATDEEKEAHSSKNSKLINLKVRWIEATEKANAALWEDRETAESRILEESVSGWDELTTGSGRVIEYSRAKGRLCEVLRDDLRAELIRAALAGATVSEADAEDLQSTPA